MRAVTRFYALAFAIAWAAEVCVIASGGLTSAPLVILYGLGWSSPALIAAWIVGREGGRAALRTFLGGFLDWRPTPWLAVAVAAPTLLLTAGAWAQTGALPAWTFSLTLLTVLGVLPALAEEPGWRGFAFPRLEAAWGTAAAAVVTGLLWAVWHLPAWFIPGARIDIALLPAYLVNTAAAGVLVAWLYHEARGQLAVAIAFHVGLNLSLVAPSSLSPAAYDLATVAFVVAAAAALLRLARHKGSARTLSPAHETSGRPGG